MRTFGHEAFADRHGRRAHRGASGDDGDAEPGGVMRAGVWELALVHFRVLACQGLTRLSLVQRYAVSKQVVASASRPLERLSRLPMANCRGSDRREKCVPTFAQGEV